MKFLWGNWQENKNKTTKTNKMNEKQEQLVIKRLFSVLNNGTISLSEYTNYVDTLTVFECAIVFGTCCRFMCNTEFNDPLFVSKFETIAQLIHNKYVDVRTSFKNKKYIHNISVGTDERKKEVIYPIIEKWENARIENGGLKDDENYESVFDSFDFQMQLLYHYDFVEFCKIIMCGCCY